MDKETVINRIKRGGFSIISDTRLPNNYGDQIKLSNGCIVNYFDTGKLSYQGKNQEMVKAVVEVSETADGNNKVFVVYGHDSVARTQLEAMLRRWELKPLILDQLESSGATIIEKLEEYIPQANYGIVLATPDDEGYPADETDKKKYRVRQNVVLELGMLLSRLGRAKVAILLKNASDMEKPSDIDGLIYIPFNENVEDTKVSLAKEMKKNGYVIDISSL